MDPNFNYPEFQRMFEEFQINNPELFQQQNLIPAYSSSSSDEEYIIPYNEILENVRNTLQQEIPHLLQPQPNRTRNYINRDWAMGHNRLFHDYFAENPVYPEKYFRRRYRMRKHVFLRIQQACEEHDEEFQQRPDATGRLGLSSLQKITAAMWMLAYGTSADKDDHYIRIGASTARVALLKFTEAVIARFGDEYLREPNESDLHRLLQIGDHRGFPGMIGSIDCMHWEWKNCPMAWKGQYQGRSGRASIILEAVASQDLWIWHAFFGTPGSLNNLNVLSRSPLFDKMMEGTTPQVSFEVNGNTYDQSYYLTYGIYPPWACFIQSINLPQTPKDNLFKQRQEAVRKDVERTFGVLQARFAVLRNPSLAWDRDILDKIMMTCIILHNMIVEDERDTYRNYVDTREFYELPPEFGTRGYTVIQQEGPLDVSTNRIAQIGTFLENRGRLRDRQTHMALKRDLIEHVWQKYGN